MKPEDKAYRLIRKNGIKTGSRVWGVGNPSSDYDFIVKHTTYQKIRSISGFFITLSDNRSGNYDTSSYPTFYFKYKERVINVICPPTIQEHEAWVWATECLKNLSDKVSIRDKERRVEVFQNLRELYKHQIDYSGVGEDVPF